MCETSYSRKGRGDTERSFACTFNILRELLSLYLGRTAYFFVHIQNQSLCVSSLLTEQVAQRRPSVRYDCLEWHCQHALLIEAHWAVRGESSEFQDGSQHRVPPISHPAAVAAEEGSGWKPADPASFPLRLRPSVPHEPLHHLCDNPVSPLSHHPSGLLHSANVSVTNRRKTG